MKSPFNLAFTTTFSGSVAAGTTAASDVGPANIDQVFGHDHLKPLKEMQHNRMLAGQSVLDLSMVNPDLAPPRIMIDRLLEAVTKPVSHRYAVSRGVRRLRDGFAEKYAYRFGINLDPERQVCVCLGSKDATFHALRVLVHPRDSVVVAAPAYPALLSAVALVGGVSVEWRHSTDPERAAQDPERAAQDPERAAQSLAQLLDSSGAKVLLLNFPSNPAGTVVSAQWWERIGAICAARGVTIINDFVYGEMCFSGTPAVSALSVTKQGARCVEVYSLSKAYNVPGWRVGALVGDEAIVRTVARLKSHADYGLFLPLQYAAAVALTAKEDLVRQTVSTYERRIRVLTSGLTKLGWDVTEPQAGACVWARFPLSLQTKSEGRFGSIAVAESLLSNGGVLVAPGSVFGEGFNDYVRFAAVVSEERMREVVSAIAKLSNANSR